jgi:general secretion pathway protein D
MPKNSVSSVLRTACQGLVCFLALSCALPIPLHAQSPPAASPRLSLEETLDTLGDLSLQDATIEKALFTIAASWNVNIVVGKDIKGSVSCIYKQTPLREVLDAILLANGYSYRAVGDSLVVQEAQDVGSANPLFQSSTIPISHSDMQEVVEGARLLLSKQGQLKALESANSILVVDFADRVASIQQFVARMDAAAAKSTGGVPAESYKRLTTAYFHTQYIAVESTREPLSTVLSQEGRIGTMLAENRLVVTDYPSNIAMVRKVLEKIDRPLPQVRITALIYDISLQDVERLGLNWNSVGKGRNLDGNGDPQQAFTFDTTTLAPFAASAAGGTATIKSLTRNFDITTVGLMLQNANDARLLANPNVTVMENRSAEMRSVQEIPFQQLSQSELGGQLATTAFKPVGIILKVTPTVAADGTVLLDVEQEFSRVSGFTENDNQPIVDTRNANTTVRVANRQTLVIGGLRQRSDTGDFNGIPFLKDVKYLGPLFRSRNTTVRESELVVFLMPEIVAYDEPHSPREYMAQETVKCRLDRIPMAEGCGGPNGGNCDAGSASYYEPVPLPPVDDEDSLLPPAPTQYPAHRSNTAPFRTGFDDRYRAPGGTDARRESLRGSTAKEQEKQSAKGSAWKRIFGS